MYLRLVQTDKGKKLYCPNGSILNVDNEILVRFFSEFSRPSSFKGEDGHWSRLFPTMDNATGITLAYVDEAYRLVVLTPTAFGNLLADEKYINTTEYARLHGKGVAIIKRLCAEGRIAGAYRTSSGWLIPENTPYPKRKSREV